MSKEVGDRSIEEEIWNIYTYYSMNSNPRDPVKLSSIGFSKFCRDIMVHDASMTEKPILPADVHLLFTSEVKKNQMQSKNHQEGKDKLNFDEFLSCLNHLASRCYPSCSTVEESMQQLLMDNVLSLALRRDPSNIASIVHHPPIEAILTFFQDPLKELYNHFASSTEKRAQVSNIIKTTSKHTMTFDEHKEDMEYWDSLKLKSSTTQASVCKMQYSDFVKFAQDFGIVSSIGLTNLDVADIFLTVTALTDFAPELGRFDFKQFCEALVRCALTAYVSYTHVSSEDKVKAMLLSIWRYIHSTMQDQLATYRGTAGGFYTGHSGGFLRGAQLFNERFIAFWTKDGYMDYLEGKAAPPIDQATRGSMTMSALLGQMSLSSNPSSPRTPLRSPSSQLNPDSTSKKNKKVLSPMAITSRKVHHSKEQLAETITKETNMSRRKITINIEDDDHVGDDRIRASDLRKLLRAKPELAELLYKHIQALGLEDH